MIMKFGLTVIMKFGALISCILPFSHALTVWYHSSPGPILVASNALTMNNNKIHFRKSISISSVTNEVLTFDTPWVGETLAIS